MKVDSYTAEANASHREAMGRSSGHAQGLQEGQRQGYSSGYSDGVQVGQQNGYNQGYSQATNDLRPELQRLHNEYEQLRVLTNAALVALGCTTDILAQSATTEQHVAFSRLYIQRCDEATRKGLSVPPHTLNSLAGCQPNSVTFIKKALLAAAVATTRSTR